MTLRGVTWRYLPLQVINRQVFRVLNVVKLVVRQPKGKGEKDVHLTCVAQQMADGRIRQRSFVPSAKMLEGETPAVAGVTAARARTGGLW